MTYSLIVMVFALLVVVTNIIVQVVKSISGIKDKPTKIIATVVGIFLTVASLVAYCEINSIAITWYYIVSSVVIGVIVAYGSIFGFDNLYGEFLDKLKDILAKKG